jgi:6,7-dimethyl-8-ribityllumazine synthase
MTDRTGSYNPFEDTGDWPFRESTAPPVDQDRPFDREELDSARAPEPADQPEPAPEPESEPHFELVPDELEDPEPEPSALAAPPPESDSSAEPELEEEPERQPQSVLAAPIEADEVEADEEEDEEQDEEQDEAPHEDGSQLGQAEPVAAFAAVAPAAEGLEEHAPGDLRIPEGPEVLEGGANGFRRTVAIVVSRFNADVTNRLLESAVDALVDAHVTRESITVVPVPGAFELPLAAMAIAKTRRFSCVVALGCVIRGETPHFDYVASEAASGLQLAAIETGVPVSFGLLTCETKEQADARVGKGADAAHAALEMADLFTQVRTRATRSG